MSNFSLAKVNFHRNYGKVFAFTHSKELCYRNFVTESLLMYLCLFCKHCKGQRCLSHPTSLINASKSGKTLSHCPRRYRKTLSNIFGKDLGW